MPFPKIKPWMLYIVGTLRRAEKLGGQTMQRELGKKERKKETRDMLAAKTRQYYKIDSKLKNG